MGFNSGFKGLNTKTSEQAAVFVNEMC